jgi:hypothetical protein
MVHDKLNNYKLDFIGQKSNRDNCKYNPNKFNQKKIKILINNEQKNIETIYKKEIENIPNHSYNIINKKILLDLWFMNELLNIQSTKNNSLNLNTQIIENTERIKSLEDEYK